MELPSVISVLNELLTLEQAAPAPRMFESTVFISQLSIDDWPVAKRIAATSQKHSAMLAEFIQDIGGTPGLRAQDVMTADLHFQELRWALPRLITQQQTLIEKYNIASKYVASHAAASSLINQITKQHQESLASLQELQSHQGNQTETVS